MRAAPRFRCVLLLSLGLGAAALHAQDRKGPARSGPDGKLSAILGRPTDRSVTLSVLSAVEIEAFVEYRGGKTAARKSPAGVPFEFEIGSLAADTEYSYRLFTRMPGGGDFKAGLQGAFHTQRAPGSPFVFALQGDSHPEREGKMYSPDLYVRTMRNVAADQPDFYITLGDDFSIERLIERKMLDQPAVDQVYAHQRGFLGVVARSSALFLVNGNHEQAARYLLDGTENSAAVLAGRARLRFYPLPVPDAFYGGDAEEVPHLGKPRDYYSWTWGDALFAVIDPYWHSAVAVDNEAGADRADKGEKGEKKRGGKNRDLWGSTLGDAQYRWLAKTLTDSRARWKFVFSHHVLGTGRGGVEMAGLGEWGGKDRRGGFLFSEKRPGWERPIHDLMVKAGVTVFFMGHDHLYARQELDGVVYQSSPNPADPTYQVFNREAYRSGDVFPNSGHLRVKVAPGEVRVDYVLSFLPADEGPGKANGAVAHSYTITSARKGEKP